MTPTEPITAADRTVAAAIRRELPAIGNMARILNLVAAATGVSVTALRGPRSDRQAAHPRFAVMWLARKITRLSLPQIGRELGDRDHTTIISGLRRANEMRAEDEQFRHLTDRVLEHFTGDE